MNDFRILSKQLIIHDGLSISVFVFRGRKTRAFSLSHLPEACVNQDTCRRSIYHSKRNLVLHVPNASRVDQLLMHFACFPALYAARLIAAPT